MLARCLATLLLLALPAVAAADTLDQIKERGTIRLGVRADAIPFSFEDNDKKPSGYTVELKLTRDGAGRRAGVATGSAPHDSTTQAQGGEPNRGQLPDGGALSSVEVIDRITGESRVEYHQGGRAIGYEDPESGMSVAR